MTGAACADPPTHPNPASSATLSACDTCLATIPIPSCAAFAAELIGFLGNCSRAPAGAQLPRKLAKSHDSASIRFHSMNSANINLTMEETPHLRV